MPSTSWDEYLADFIENAPREELLLYAAHCEAIITKGDNAPADNESKD